MVPDPLNDPRHAPPPLLPERLLLRPLIEAFIGRALFLNRNYGKATTRRKRL